MFLQNETVSTAISHEIPFPALPEELIREILLKLPVKSLVQLKCVCKLWKTLISDSQFVNSHLQIQIPRMNTQQLVFSDLENPYKIVSYSLDSLFQNPSSTRVEPSILSYVKNCKYRKYRIIGSCNGLLCLFHSYKNIVQLLNPSIRFESNKSPEAVSRDWLIVQYGFGYDHVNDKYKVLVVAKYIYDPTQFLTKIYTFCQNSWKTIPNFTIRPNSRLGKFVSGTLNWIIYKSGVSSNQNHNVIFSFDLEKETYMELLLPESDADNVWFTYRMLYVLNNYLCVSNCNGLGVVWLMKEYGVVDSWTKLMTIPPKYIDNYFSSVEPLFISKNNVLFMRTHYSQVSINIRNQTSLDEPLFISGNGSVALGKKPSSQLFLYNSNSGQVDPLITSTLGFNLRIYHASLVSPQ